MIGCVWICAGGIELLPNAVGAVIGDVGALVFVSWFAVELVECACSWASCALVLDRVPDAVAACEMIDSTSSSLSASVESGVEIVVSDRSLRSLYRGLGVRCPGSVKLIVLFRSGWLRRSPAATSSSRRLREVVLALVIVAYSLEPGRYYEIPTSPRWPPK